MVSRTVHDIWQPSEDFGFLPTRDGASLDSPDVLGPAEALLAQVPSILRDSNRAALCRACEALPVAQLGAALRDSPAAAEQAFVVYAFLAQSYLCRGEETQPPTLELCEPIAVPWAAAAEACGRHVSFDYAACVLWNVEWTRLDEPSSKLAPPPQPRARWTVTGSKDEAHFYEVHARIELAAAPAVGALLRGMAACDAGEPAERMSEMESALRTLADSLSEMAELLPLIPRGCSPAYFYSTMRTYLSAPCDAPVHLRGVGRVVKLTGASGAQSAIIPCIDCFLGVAHNGHAELPQYRLDGLEPGAQPAASGGELPYEPHPVPLSHLPSSHKAMLARVRARPPASLAALAALGGPKAADKADKAAASMAASLHELRDLCLLRLMRWRKAHMGLVRAYIFAQPGLQPLPNAPASPRLAGYPEQLTGQEGQRPEGQRPAARELLPRSPPAVGNASGVVATIASAIGTGGTLILDFLAGRCVRPPGP